MAAVIYNAENLADHGWDDDEIDEILERSCEEWLTGEDMRVLRTRAYLFPIENVRSIALGAEGIYRTDCRSTFDNNNWNTRSYELGAWRSEIRVFHVREIHQFNDDGTYIRSVWRDGYRGNNEENPIITFANYWRFL